TLTRYGFSAVPLFSATGIGAWSSIRCILNIICSGGVAEAFIICIQEIPGISGSTTSGYTRFSGVDKDSLILNDRNGLDDSLVEYLKTTGISPTELRACIHFGMDHRERVRMLTKWEVTNAQFPLDEDYV
ncbi:hypothetical protein SARC_11801, partial [Sphaeroforma arctica JP610]